MNPQQTARRSLNSLIDRNEAIRAYDWPFTARGPQPLYSLVRRMIIEAEDYIEEGEFEAAMSACKAGESTLTALVDLYAHSTLEV